MQREMMVYIPELACFLYAAEGTGDNLLHEDIEQGYVDYINIETYTYQDRELIESDGGMKLMTRMFDDVYEDDENGDQLVKDAMDMMFDSDKYAYVVIREG